MELLPQFCQEMRRSWQWGYALCQCLYIDQSQSIFLEQFDAAIHETGIVRFLSGRDCQICDSGGFCDVRPQFGDQYPFHINAGDIFHAKSHFGENASQKPRLARMAPIMRFNTIWCCSIFERKCSSEKKTVTRLNHTQCASDMNNP